MLQKYFGNIFIHLSPTVNKDELKLLTIVSVVLNKNIQNNESSVWKRCAWRTFIVCSTNKFWEKNLYFIKIEHLMIAVKVNFLINKYTQRVIFYDLWYFTRALVINLYISLKNEENRQSVLQMWAPRLFL